jgi:hypothetical protein
VLTHDDDFTIIDLDKTEISDPEIKEEHEWIIDLVDSYTERSCQKSGYHIIVRGKIPRAYKDAKRQIEAYSFDRYMICTGDVVRAHQIENRQPFLDWFFLQDRPAVVTTTGEATESDDDIMERIGRASNAHAVKALLGGDWSRYGSQSEADSALISHLLFYTQNEDQVMRMFRASGLGKRDKAKRDDYLRRTIRNAPRQEELKTHTAIEAITATAAYKEEPKKKIAFPPGRMGELARHISDNARRPFDEVGIVAALGVMAGISGRAYNISSAGLNLYIILIAGTGRGKEGVARGVESVISELIKDVAGITLRMGPAQFASGQALLKTVAKTPCFVSIHGEFAHMLAQMHDATIGHMAMMKKVYLDLFSKSGHGSILRAYAYAQDDKNTDVISGPAFSFIGESASKTFFEKIQEAHIAEGLIPRFLIVQYDGARSYLNQRPPQNMPADLHHAVRLVAETSCANELTDKVIHVEQDARAAEILEEYERKTTDQINAGGDSVDDELRNRAHLHALKLSALCAVLEDNLRPVINEQQARWAVDTVNVCVDNMIAQYQSGEHSNGYVAVQAIIKKEILGWAKMPKKTRKAYGCPAPMLDNKDMIPEPVLRRRLMSKRVLTELGANADRVFERALELMVKEEVIYKVSGRAETGISRPCYSIGSSF